MTEARPANATGSPPPPPKNTTAEDGGLHPNGQNPPFFTPNNIFLLCFSTAGFFILALAVCFCVWLNHRVAVEKKEKEEERRLRIQNQVALNRVLEERGIYGVREDCPPPLNLTNVSR
jgi:hypothetical protein